MWHFNRIAQGCLKCMPMIPVISWQPGHGSLSAHFSPVSSTEDKHLVANFEQVAQTRNDVTATSNPHRSLSCCNATGGQRKGRGAFPHLTALHADFVEAWKVDGLFRGCRRQEDEEQRAGESLHFRGIQKSHLTFGATWIGVGFPALLGLLFCFFLVEQTAYCFYFSAFSPYNDHTLYMLFSQNLRGDFDFINS